MRRPLSKGAAMLKALINPKVHTQASVARAAGVSPEAVRHWFEFGAVPKPERLAALEAAFGIPASSWDEPNDEPESSGEAA